jgi:hypothetical protein
MENKTGTAKIAHPKKKYGEITHFKLLMPGA